MQANAKTDSAAVASSTGAHISHFFSDFSGRFAPRQVRVHLLGCQFMRCFGRPAEINRRVRPLNGRVQQLCAGHAQVPTLEVKWLTTVAARDDFTPDADEFGRLFVPLSMV